jgi:hypothetical protein
MTYEEAVEELKDVPRPSLEEFIKVGKNDFIYFEKLYGAGFILHAIEIAELLKERNEKNCTGYRDEHGSRYDPFVRNSGH